MISVMIGKPKDHRRNTEKSVLNNTERRVQFLWWPAEFLDRMWTTSRKTIKSSTKNEEIVVIERNTTNQSNHACEQTKPQQCWKRNIVHDKPSKLSPHVLNPTDSSPSDSEIHGSSSLTELWCATQNDAYKRYHACAVACTNMQWSVSCFRVYNMSYYHISFYG